jgi:hypothetical protein
MGAPATRIVEEAQQGAYDLIVMGTHGRTGLSHMLIGSVAERVVRTSGCPVLTVPAKSAGLSAHLGPPTERFTPTGADDANLARPHDE